MTTYIKFTLRLQKEELHELKELLRNNIFNAASRNILLLSHIQLNEILKQIEEQEVLDELMDDIENGRVNY